MCGSKLELCSLIREDTANVSVITKASSLLENVINKGQCYWLEENKVLPETQAS